MEQVVVDLTHDDTLVVTISDSPKSPKRIEVVDLSCDTDDRGTTGRVRRTSGAQTTRRLSYTPEQRRGRSRGAVLECPICIESFQELNKRGSKCIVTVCGHLFCDKCIEAAFKQQNTRNCPKCRKGLPKKNGYLQVFDIC